MWRKGTRRRKKETAAERSGLPSPTDLMPQLTMDEMDGDLWSGLPLEVEERMLSFLSVPVLCRFRIVCKRWNSLICNPHFGALCIQNRRAQDFIVACCDGACATEYSNLLGWRFLDLNARRWYTIRRDKDDMVELFHTRSLAMDGGLVCAYYLDSSNEDPFSVIVSNPIAKTFRRLPPSPYYLKNPKRSSRVSPVMDSHGTLSTTSPRSFRFFSCLALLSGKISLRIGLNHSGLTFMSRQPINGGAPPPLKGFFSSMMQPVIFEGMLYVLITPVTKFKENWQLWSYNPVEDAWKNPGAESDTHTVLLHPQLIVANNRIYLVSWVTPRDHQISVDVTPTLI